MIECNGASWYYPKIRRDMTKQIAGPDILEKSSYSHQLGSDCYVAPKWAPKLKFRRHIDDQQACTKIWAAFRDLGHLNSRVMECNGSSRCHLKIRRHIDDSQARTKFWAAFRDLDHLNSRMIECNRSSWYYFTICRHIVNLQAHTKVWAAFIDLAHLSSRMIECIRRFTGKWQNFGSI